MKNIILGLLIFTGVAFAQQGGQFSSGGGGGGNADVATRSLKCSPAGASATAYTCTTNPSFTPATGSKVTLIPDVDSGVSPTLAVNGASAAGIYVRGGQAAAGAGDLKAAKPIMLTYDAAGHWDADDKATDIAITNPTNGNVGVYLSAGPSIDFNSPTVKFTSGTSRTIGNTAEIIVCTSTCTVTPPASAVVGSQFCVQNDDNVSTVITLAAVTGVQYEATARTSYGTANHTMTSGGAVKDQMCMVAISATKWNVFSSVGSWTNN